ncbi:hypothetical protein [Dyadobacter fanqingshengii]|uniref:Uncharacterized protein n=1 Tax=Dyadobacter fanqingshengii TaxID=2906443 RepID=A0A9X1T7X8_9BACT|nr:hypothetical protein [Dyadobacter fanqingshengii]MCF0038793.1 hypothetical protein [Dyadobacter fanqingshengii]USJ34379.1 hypothetical protein NFI81_16880 [Dyadobacter fanqingshengii]
MHTKQCQESRQNAAEELLGNYLNQDVDLIEIERMHNEMLRHYLRPTDEWNLSRKYALLALDTSEVITRLLKEIGDYGKDFKRLG